MSQLDHPAVTTEPAHRPQCWHGYWWLQTDSVAHTEASRAIYVPSAATAESYRSVIPLSLTNVSAATGTQPAPHTSARASELPPAPPGALEQLRAYTGHLQRATFRCRSQTKCCPLASGLTAAQTLVPLALAPSSFSAGPSCLGHRTLCMVGALPPCWLCCSWDSLCSLQICMALESPCALAA